MSRLSLTHKEDASVALEIFLYGCLVEEDAESLVPRDLAVTAFH